LENNLDLEKRSPVKVMGVRISIVESVPELLIVVFTPYFLQAHDVIIVVIKIICNLMMLMIEPRRERNEKLTCNVLNANVLVL